MDVPSAVPNTDDAEILQMFALPSQQNKAFGMLVQKYQEKVYWLVRKMVIDHDDANDLTQDIFIKVWHRLGSFRQESKLFTWIYRIAVNECLNYLAKKRRRFLLPLTDVASELETKLDNSQGFTGDEIQKKLQKAILKLPDKQRLVFNMKYFEDMGYQEMSEILGTSVGALKASYHFAVKKLEDFLTKG